eukprot:IDg17254t1
MCNLSPSSSVLVLYARVCWCLLVLAPVLCSSCRFYQPYSPATALDLGHCTHLSRLLLPVRKGKSQFIVR